MNKTSDILFWKCTDSWDNNIPISVRVDLDNFHLNIVQIVLILIGWSPKMNFRINKVTMIKRFIWNLLKVDIKYEGTWWEGVGTVTCTIINWPHWIYNGVKYWLSRGSEYRDSKYIGCSTSNDITASICRTQARAWHFTSDVWRCKNPILFYPNTMAARDLFWD